MEIREGGPGCQGCYGLRLVGVGDEMWWDMEFKDIRKYI